MPITARPDPNNPTQFVWVDAATGAPAVQPDGPGTTFVAPSDLTDAQRQKLGMPPGPAASAAPAASTTPSSGGTTTTTTTPAGQAQGAATTAAQNPPSVGTPQGSQGMFTPDQATAQSAAEVQQANLGVAAGWDEVQKQQKAVDDIRAGGLSADPTGAKLQSATNSLNAAYSQLSQAEARLESANATYATSLNNAIKSANLDPSQIQQAQAQAAQATAAADEAKARTALLTDDTPGGQRALNAAQAGLASANAAAAQANADATKAKTPAEVDQLTQQAAALRAQAAQTNALIGTPDNPGPLIRKANEEVNTQVATTGQINSQTALNAATARRQDADASLSTAQANQVNATVAAGGPQATVAATQAQAAANQATADKTRQDIEKARLGPAYGLQDQIAAIQAIQQHVFGPGGTGKPEDADDLLNQFFTATVGGTTPFEAAKAVAGQQSINYGTQMAGVNALQAAQASRAGTLGGLAGNTLGTLAGMNAYAPKGSDAMAGAFAGVMGAMANKLAGPQYGPVQLPNPPPLPGFLAGFAAGHQAGSAQAGPAPTGGGQAAPTVNINVNGQPTNVDRNPALDAANVTNQYGFNPQASTAAQRAAASAGPTTAPGVGAAPPSPPPPANTGYSSPPPINQDVPSFLSSVGLNLPNPMAVLRGQPYVGLGM